jgi:hypothetical protein
MATAVIKLMARPTLGPTTTPTAPYPFFNTV